MTGHPYTSVALISSPFICKTEIPPLLRNSLKAMRNLPYPLRWYGGRVRIHATLFPSGDSFSCIHTQKIKRK